MTRTLRNILWGLAALLAVGRPADKAGADPLPVGAAAPTYSLPDQNGKGHTLAKDRGHVVLLAFYPADFTGGCTLEAHSLTAAYKDLKAQGVRVYGVSVQDSKSHKGFCSKEGIPYTLLADTQKTTSQSYGVLMPQGFANRVTYIIGKNGKIAYVDPNVNGHLMTCGRDWSDWLRAHPQVLGSRRADAGPTTVAAFLLERATPLYTATLGQPAPTFALPEVATGRTTSLKSLEKGKKATVVMFIATRCPVSNSYNDRMVALAGKYAAQGVAFVGINANQTEPVKECADHAKQHHFPFPVLKDADDAVADAYDAHVTPETYVIDAKGTLVYHGRIDNDMDPADVKTHDLADALDAVLAGKPVAVSRTKAFGCTIKRGR
ncbi:MAG: redoxin domain-containing protein [Armatimonadetes bacterium]|nr:redoxin domain-containing protein [Armatimonadota bacterium]